MDPKKEPRKGCCDRCGALACEPDEYVCPPCKAVLYRGAPLSSAPINPLRPGKL